MRDRDIERPGNISPGYHSPLRTSNAFPQPFHMPVVSTRTPSWWRLMPIPNSQEFPVCAGIMPSSTCTVRIYASLRRTFHVAFFMPGGSGSEGPSSSSTSIVVQIFGSGGAICSMLSSSSHSARDAPMLCVLVCTLLPFCVRSWLVSPSAMARRLRRELEPMVGVSPEDVAFEAEL